MASHGISRSINEQNLTTDEDIISAALNVWLLDHFVLNHYLHVLLAPILRGHSLVSDLLPLYYSSQFNWPTRSQKMLLKLEYLHTYQESILDLRVFVQQWCYLNNNYTIYTVLTTIYLVIFMVKKCSHFLQELICKVVFTRLLYWIPCLHCS